MKAVCQGNRVNEGPQRPHPQKSHGTTGRIPEGNSLTEVRSDPLVRGTLGEDPPREGEEGTRNPKGDQAWELRTRGQRPARRIPSAAPVLLDLVRTTRPKQWVKNAFVLAPVVFAHNLFEEKVLLRAVLAFATFSVLSGAVYTLNDLVDVDDDRKHPTKRDRPIASGKVPPRIAKVFAAVLVVVALGAAWRIGHPVAGAAAAYLALNLAYSLRLKQVAYLDVVCIAVFFVLRVVAGCYAVSTWSHPVRPSLYLLACTAFLSLFQGFGKRYHELSVNAAKARGALRAYSPRVLRATLGVTAVSTVVVYLGWTLDPPIQLAFARGYLWVTTPLVMVGIGRFVWLLGSSHGESPTDAMLKDVTFVLIVVSWVAVVVTIIYRLRPA